MSASNSNGSCTPLCRQVCFQLDLELMIVVDFTSRTSCSTPFPYRFTMVMGFLQGPYIYVALFALLIVPVFTYIAILRYHLYDIDVVINRTLVYGALSACVVGIYVLTIVALGALFQAQGNLGVSLLATGLVAVLFQPLRSRLQRGVNRLMYGERDDPYAVISRLGKRFEAALAPETVLPTIVGIVREALKLPYAAIALPQDGNDFEIVAASGEEPPADPLVLPLSYGGESVGELLLAPRAPGESFSSADRRLLDGLAGHAGVAVHGVRVMADLRRSRERLVLAREEERRRLRRDLHDELAPTLAALGLDAATVGELIPTDPKEAAFANEKLRSAIRATVGDVRRLVYDLRPPALDELGLVEAMRQRASRLGVGDEGFLATVEAPDELPPPAGGRRGGRLPHRAGSADERLPPRSGERVHRPAGLRRRPGAYHRGHRRRRRAAGDAGGRSWPLLDARARR